MKSTTLFFLLITASISCKAQILPVEDYRTYIELGEGIPENTTYIKDVNNVLNKYTGTWIGTFEGKTYEFRIKKITESRYDGDLLVDQLIIHYKITNSNGAILADNLNLPDDHPDVISGLYLGKNEVYKLQHKGKNPQCGQGGELQIKLKNGSLSTLYAYLFPEGDLVDIADCPDGPYEQIFPTGSETLILTRQL
ncbi:MAG: hypothetical protein CL868_11890 [Cytophagaceae bacterium]|nr:hypothetical protein [Cytophagaceae bacterium]